jgi:hypothetical protein
MNASLLLALAALSTAHAAEPATLTLACKGTTTDMTKTDAKPEPISMGIVINFTARTVEGFTYPGANRLVKIGAVNETTVMFGTDEGGWEISGSVDRVTGDVAATSIWFNRDHDMTQGTEYSLKCKPTQRMF